MVALACHGLSREGSHEELYSRLAAHLVHQLLDTPSEPASKRKRAQAPKQDKAARRSKEQWWDFLRSETPKVKQGMPHLTTRVQVLREVRLWPRSNPLAPSPVFARFGANRVPDCLAPS